MTPQERANAYWQSQRDADDDYLAEWFKRCHNEAIEQAAKRVMHSGDREAILRIKH